MSHNSRSGKKTNRSCTRFPRVNHLSVVLQPLDDFGRHPIRRSHHARALVLFRRQCSRETEVGQLHLALQVNLIKAKVNATKKIKNVHEKVTKQQVSVTAHNETVHERQTKQ